MLGTIRDFKYKKINNFLSEDEINLMTNYCKIKHSFNTDSFDDIQSVNKDTYFYEDPLMQSLLIKKKPFMEKETGLLLHESYAFWRMYSYAADLKKHLDRPSCEISVTANINSDGTPWPIFMEGEAVDLNPGDAVIYLGCELNHWRDNFKGDWCAQVFMHYVDQNGPHKELKWDGNKFNGV